MSECTFVRVDRVIKAPAAAMATSRTLERLAEITESGA